MTPGFLVPTTGLLTVNNLNASKFPSAHEYLYKIYICLENIYTGLKRNI